MADRMPSPAPEPQTQGDHEDPEDDGVRAEPEGDRHRARSREEQQQGADSQRGDATEGEQPLVVDAPAQANGGADLHRSGQDRPEGDQVEQRQRRDAGAKDGEDPDHDAGHPLE